jgi:outer membrane lipoprotein SlyB
MERIAARAIDGESAKPFASMSREVIVMKTVTALLAVAAFAFAANSAEAKGCLKGAVVGGVAGHYAGHHGMLGAAAGCLYGRHRAKEQQRQQHGAEQH